MATRSRQRTRRRAPAAEEGAIRISAKNLGGLALPGCCRRCFYLKLHNRFTGPWQVFPGIFSSIDSFTKNVAHAYFDRHGCAPPWLADLGDVTGYVEPPHYSRFQLVDEHYGVRLTGAPDGILVRAGGGHVIVDYKTARFTAHQDELLPMYQVQLNVYAMIAEACGIRPVTDLALVYMEPLTDRCTNDAACRKNGFRMDFGAHILPVERNPHLVDPLLARVCEIYHLTSPPPAAEGCKDCAILERLLSLVSGG